ncbi:hypothetical protein M408DRAFT_211506 [Serendipita vermifera MAFF 305830]|uniref:Uncharacterized protein n=1 Tax=Serendipita vermifera MAFF 305830 TaxID=933852 RepID=A0A0C2WGE4_SERVB|nr:hypothetical protein M408DRAFT_211506 [Serendipita vermifera MAFF 305830]
MLGSSKTDSHDFSWFLAVTSRHFSDKSSSQVCRMIGKAVYSIIKRNKHPLTQPLQEGLLTSSVLLAGFLGNAGFSDYSGSCFGGGLCSCFGSGLGGLLAGASCGRFSRLRGIATSGFSCGLVRRSGSCRLSTGSSTGSSGLALGGLDAFRSLRALGGFDSFCSLDTLWGLDGLGTFDGLASLGSS